MFVAQPGGWIPQQLVEDGWLRLEGTRQTQQRHNPGLNLPTDCAVVVATDKMLGL